MTDPLTLVGSLVGKRPWSVQLGVGSFLLFDFGQTVQASAGVTRGEWCLWLYCTPWRIRTETRLLLGSEDTREKIAAEIKQLENKTVVRCDLIKPTLDLVITFENGLRLETFSFDNTDAEHWKLFAPDSMILVAGPGFNLRYGRADLPQDELEPLTV